MKAAAMDHARLAELRLVICDDAADDTPGASCLNIVREHVRELLADRDHHAAGVAAVIDVMARLDDQRGEDASHPGRFAEGGESRIRTALSQLRVALGLPSEWSDGADEPVAKGYQDTPLTADDLVRRAVQSAGHGGDHPLPRWSWVGSVFGLGSTSSTALCRRFDVDPDEMRGEYSDDDECDMRDGGEG